MKYLEIIPDFLTMCGVFTSQSTSKIRQEMSICITRGGLGPVGTVRVPYVYTVYNDFAN